MASKPKDSSMKTVVAVSALVLISGTVPRGTSYELPAAEAEDLVARGHAAWPSAETPAPALIPPKDQTARVAVIIKAMEALDHDEDFTAKGLPSLAALTRVLGWEPSPEDRAKAVAEAANLPVSK